MMPCPADFTHSHFLLVLLCRLGAPDTGLMSYAEMVDSGRNMHEATRALPIIGDGDTGEPLNLARPGDARSLQPDFPGCDQTHLGKFELTQGKGCAQHLLAAKVPAEG